MVLLLHLSMGIRLIKVQVDYPSHPVPKSETQTVVDPRGDAALDTSEVSASQIFRPFPTIPDTCLGTSFTPGLCIVTSWDAIVMLKRCCFT